MKDWVSVRRGREKCIAYEKCTTYALEALGIQTSAMVDIRRRAVSK
jgi:hypothetical protein